MTWPRFRAVLLTLAIAAAWLVPQLWLVSTPASESTGGPRYASFDDAATNSLLVALAGAGAACLLGGILAALVESAGVRWRAWWLAALSLPLLLPAYLVAIAWAPLLSPTGMVVLPASTVHEFNLRAFLSVAWIHCCAWYPVALLIFHSAARLWSSKYDEVARASGFTGIQVTRMRLRWYSWPALAAFAIVSLMVLADFSVADYFGVRTLGTEIFAIVSAYLDPAAALEA